MLHSPIEDTKCCKQVPVTFKAEKVAKIHTKQHPRTSVRELPTISTNTTLHTKVSVIASITVREKVLQYCKHRLCLQKLLNLKQLPSCNDNFK